MSLVILVPMLGRAYHVAPLLASIRETTPDARVLFLTTRGDVEVVATLQEMSEEQYRLPIQERGDYAIKINTGIAVTSEDHIFTGASDLRFHPGWYEAAVAKLRPGIGVVGTNDLGNRGTANGRHATHMLVTREYVENFGTIDEPGKFFHEGYVHECVDNEAVETAQVRGAYAHAADSYVEHLHPLWGKADWDEMYRQTSDRIAAGQRLFMERRRMWRR